MSEYDWESLPNYPWAGCLACNLRQPAAHWAECLARAAAYVEEASRAIDREWRVMARDPLFKFYGGVDSTERRRDYAARRIDELLRSVVRPWAGSAMPPPDRALAAALEAARPT